MLGSVTNLFFSWQQWLGNIISIFGIWFRAVCSGLFRLNVVGVLSRILRLLWLSWLICANGLLLIGLGVGVSWTILLLLNLFCLLAWFLDSFVSLFLCCYLFIIVNTLYSFFYLLSITFLSYLSKKKKLCSLFFILICSRFFWGKKKGLKLIYLNLVN